jgi:mannose-6-phosphate isomerase-like protein (cupin superfamily)
MVLDFEKIMTQHLEGLKDGNGPYDTRNFIDENIKIAYSTLRPGSSSGYHVHENNSEVIFVISGTATFHYDDSVEEVSAGQCHYCPMGHSHYMENLTDHDLVYFAVVPNHR